MEREIPSDMQNENTGDANVETGEVSPNATRVKITRVTPTRINMRIEGLRLPEFQREVDGQAGVDSESLNEDHQN